MNINRSNYEPFLLDYLDGKLDALSVSELLLFLGQHPDIAQELEGLEGTVLLPELLSFGEKAGMKKPAYEDVKERWTMRAVAFMEGDLSEEEKTVFEADMKAYPAFSFDVAMLEKTKLQPDVSINFGRKRQLKKTVPLSLRTNDLWKVAAAAAVVALLLLPSGSPERESLEKRQTALLQKTVSTLPQTARPLSPGHASQANHVQRQHATSPVQSKQPSAPATSLTVGIAITRQKPVHPLKISALSAVVNSLNPVAPVLEKPLPPVSENTYLTLPEVAASGIRKAIAGVVTEENKPQGPGSVGPSDLSLLLLKFYNRLSGDDAHVTRRYDSSGHVTRYELTAGNFQFSTGK